MSSLLKGKGEKGKEDQNVSGKQEREGKKTMTFVVTSSTGQYS